MELWKAIFLGVVQGLTEFLPISSSGHLALFNKIFPGGEADVQFFVIVHLGTMLSTLLVFGQEIIALLGSLKTFPLAVKAKKLNPRHKMCLYIILASIPTGIMGLMLDDHFEQFSHNLKFIGCMLIVTALILGATKYIKSGDRDEKNFGFLRAFWAGCFQGMAILPGISRSGMTISTILFMKGDRKFAGRYSFLMSLPAILAANVLEFSKSGGIIISFSNIVGFLVSFFVGFAALKFLLKLVQNGKFYYFSYYCLTVGLLVLVFL